MLADPIPNSSQLVLPTILAPAERSNETTVASKGDMYPSSILLEHVVGISVVQMLSLIEMGHAAKGPSEELSLRAVLPSFSSMTAR